MSTAEGHHRASSSFREEQCQRISPFDAASRLSVIVNNNLGVSYFADANYREALGFFRKALEACSSKTSSSTDVSCSPLVSVSRDQSLPEKATSAKNELSPSASAVTVEIPSRKNKNKRQLNADPLPLPSAVINPSSNSRSKASLYQRTEFDEGMHTFMEVLALNEVDEQCPHGGMTNAKAVVFFNVAQCKQRRNEYEEAAALYQSAYGIAKDQLELIVAGGKDKSANKSSSRETAIRYFVVRVLHKLGQVQYFQGLHVEARRAFQEALELSRKTLGSDHPDVASAMNCLGIVQYHTHCSTAGSTASQDGQEEEKQAKATVEGDDHSYALELFHEALQIRMCTLGVYSREVATTLNNIARIYVEREELDDALITYKEALRIRKRVLGDSHVDVAATTFNIGQTHHLRHEYDAAMEYYNQFLSKVTARYGMQDPHRDVSIVLCLMGEIYQERHDLDNAMSFYNTALQVGIAALGSPLHAEIALTLNKIGSCQLERGDVDGAIETYEQGLNIERLVLEPWHPNLIVTLKNIGELHRQRGEHDRAIAKYQEILSIRIQKLMDSYPNGYDMLDQLGGFLTRKHSDRQCSSSSSSTRQHKRQRRESSGRVPAIPKELGQQLQGVAPRTKQWKVLCDCFLDVAEAVNDLATLYCKKGSYKLALEYLQESYRIRKAILGKHHNDVAVNLYNISLIHKWCDNHDEALRCCRESLRVQRTVLGGENHICISMAYNLMGKILQEKGNLDEALRRHEEALRIARNVLGRDAANASIAEILTDIGNIHMERGTFPQMMKSFTEAARIYMLCGLSPDNIAVSSKNKRQFRVDSDVDAEPEVAAAA